MRSILKKAFLPLQKEYDTLNKEKPVLSKENEKLMKSRFCEDITQLQEKVKALI